MKISEICIQRPVLAWVLTFLLVIVGLIGGSRLPLLQYPKMERAYVTIETQLPGAAPEMVESQITKVIEESLAGLEGVEEITSTSSVEESKVTLEFIPGYSMESATNNIRDRLAKNADKLIDEATKPILTQSRAEEKPIMNLALTSETLPASELADYAEKNIKSDIESVPGVARVEVFGSGLYIMHIYLDPAKLAAHNITASDVKMAIKRHNIEKPAGKLIGKDREYLVTTVATLSDAEEFDQLVIAEKEGHLVR
ncbi:MAG: efflux RND transporter permease subunit, partial [Alphaproteobacteria bacterium]|nr:efflux RND transporter permease subunit [Alphaproteobacteria bacterium]